MFIINYLSKMYSRENISYLVPRDPSITCWDDRVKLSAEHHRPPIQLDDFEETMGDRIRVYLRLKPSVLNNNLYTVLDSRTLQTQAPKESVKYKNVTNGIGNLIHRFTFTSILDQETTQADLFNKCAVKSLKKFLSGENYLLMAYGTTSAGKTYTMQGDVENPGVIPRALDFMFTSLKDNIIPMCRYTPYQYNEFVVLGDEQSKKDLTHKNFILSLDLNKYQKYPDVTQMTFQTTSSSGFSDSYENVTFKEMQSNLIKIESFEVESDQCQYSVWISMIEIYNEQVYDLLDLPNEKGAKPKLTLRDDECGNTFVKNLRYVNVTSGHEAFQIFQFGRTNLHFAPTALNLRSSRSHCIFTITLAKFLDYDTTSSAVISRFSFCDLAGMERAKKTLNIKDRLVESKAINTSLSILVKCLTTIKENQNSKEKKMIPYRESKLTKLFRDAVLGKEQFSLIVNVTTEPNLFDETLSVLKFSAVAQKIAPQNIFVKPKLAKPVKRSRFSRIVVNSSQNSKKIDWEASTEAETKMKEGEVSGSEEGEGEGSREAEELRDLVECLREELAQERKRCEEIESKIREELTSKFLVMLRELNEKNRIRLENETETLHEMYERKQRRLVHYYQLMRNKKRPKLEDDDDDDDDGGSDDEDKENRAGETRKEAESLKEQLQEMLNEKNKLKQECSELRFELSEKDRVLEALERANKANEEGCDSLEKELRKQLDEANAKISHLKSLLDEAASDYKELEGENKYLRDENENLEQHLTVNSEAVADLKNENLELERMLSQKRIMVEKLEEANEKLREKAGAGEGEGEKSEKGEAEISQKEVEILRETLRQTSEWLGRSREECEELREKKADLEKDLEIAMLKTADLESKLQGLEECRGETDRAREVESRAEDLEREKEYLDGRCKELEAEVKNLQKEVKELIRPSEEKDVKERELEALTKENDCLQKELLGLKKRNSELEEELKKVTEDFRTAQRESKIAVESLRVKLEAVEYQNSVMKNLKDEAERQAYDVPQLHEQIKQLEKEIENRDKDMASFTENRNALFNNYEKEIARLKEENERLRRDVLFANEVIVKNVTPLKTDKAEINRLKESVRKKDEEINKLKAEVESLKAPETGEKRKASVKRQESSTVEESSSQESSPVANVRKNSKETSEEETGEKGGKRGENFERLTKQVENLSIQQTESKSTRKKIDLLEESVHPSTIKNTRRGRRKKENGKEKGTEKTTENEKEKPQSKKNGKCYKKLFTENDFEELSDLNASPLEEISRLRPRK